ncbi:MAG: PIN domain-containing protein [Euryarchaeota archaeon]|nr:PIN domain-containing protein [Euryarchaeota archaeon]
MKIYLDTCVWCRPFDKPTPRIESERRAYLKILRKVYEGKFSIVGSIFLDIEVERIEGGKKRESAKKSMDKAISEKIELVTQEILSRKREICKVGLKDMDAYHIASAVEGGAIYFISVDDEILNKRDKITEIKIRSTEEFLKEIEYGN